ncbi:MAG TPA: helix-turn-helix domain-containing protein, partial [Ramlibacter sp.]|nr:helix-turn-helix domain-containing protein [Ramlibacter sp.]
MKKTSQPPAQSPGRPRKALPSQAAPAARAAQGAAPAEAGVATLERGLSILDAFSLGAGTLSLAELAGATGLYKSTILRLCASLLRLGFLQRLDDGRYRLGPAVFQLGRRYQQ